VICAAVMCVSLVSAASAVDVEVVSVGNVGNSADTTGYGAVDYAYNIGKYEVTAGQYTDFLNAVAATDAYELYNTSMTTDTSGYGCNIVRSGSAGSYTYSVATAWANRPVNYVGVGDAARFANWLHNGQPTGLQNSTTTEDGAYFLNGATGHDLRLVMTRQADWKWALPSENEWYKAAYHKNDGDTGNYFDYPTSSSVTPSSALGSPDPGNSATYYGPGGFTSPSYYRTEVGDHENSESPYDTFDQGGNVNEWAEAADGYVFTYRGGCFATNATPLLTSYAVDGYGTTEIYKTGFRVTSIPEPATMGLLGLGFFGLVVRRRK
jgi:formylglycine-generating enzyme required for sulfatase activity